MDLFIALHSQQKQHVLKDKCPLMRNATFYSFCAGLLFSLRQTQHSTLAQVTLKVSPPDSYCNRCSTWLHTQTQASAEHPPPAEGLHFTKSTFYHTFGE